MLIRLILSPADEHRLGANQMRQHLSFREHFRRGNAVSHPVRRAAPPPATSGLYSELCVVSPRDPAGGSASGTISSAARVDGCFADRTPQRRECGRALVSSDERRSLFRSGSVIK